MLRKQHSGSKHNNSSSSKSSSISSSDLEMFIDSLRLQSRRQTTRNVYFSIWRSFNKFLLKLDYIPNLWEDKLSLYVGYLIQSGAKSCTIRSYISGIKAMLHEIGYALNENKYLLASLVRACKYKNDAVRTRLPIQKPLLQLLLNTCKSVFLDNGQVYLYHLHRAIMAVGYYGLLRIGEMTSGDHPVFASDVHISSNKEKFMFILHTSKTHWKDVKPQIVKMSTDQTESSSKHLDMNDPYRILKNFANHRPTCNSLVEPFFIFADRSPVMPAHFRAALRNTLLKAGMDARLYNCQSLRIGRACDLLDMGISVKTIKKLGRWKSKSIYTYLR